MKSLYSQFNFKRILKALAIAVIFVIATFESTHGAYAAAGIYKVINFQGKVVNKTAGTNVANGNYPMVFTIYDKPSGGTALWTENDSTVAVTDGIFRVGLGATTVFPANFNFNQDGLYLDITFNSEAMGSRVQLTAVPYAFNAGQVAGLTVQDSTSGAASTSATLKLGDATTPRTFDLGANSLAFTTSGTTTLTLPTTGTVTALGNTTTGTGTTLVLNSNPSFADLTLTSGAITLGGVTGSGLCVTGGATAAWGSCGAGGGGTNYWQLNGAVLSPGNLTTDLLLGNTATTSAKFAVTNLAGNNLIPQASISGNLIVFPDAGNKGGNVGIGTISPASRLEVGINNLQNEAITVRSKLISGIDLLGDSDNGVASGGENGGAYVNFSIDGGVNTTNIGLVQGANLDSKGNTFTGGTGNSFIISAPSSAGSVPIQLGTSGKARLSIRTDGTTIFSQGQNSPLASLDIRNQIGTLAIASVSGNVPFAALVVDNKYTSGGGDLFTASSSGLTRFTLTQNGKLALGSDALNPVFGVNELGTVTAGVWNGTALTDAYVSDTLTSSLFVGSGSSTTAVDLATAEVAGTLTYDKGGTGQSTYAQGDLIYASATNTLSKLTIGGSSTCLTSNGTTPSWGSCGAGGAGTNYWDQVSGNGVTTGGYIAPFNKTADLLLGSIATSSAKFGFLNVLTGTPTASISASSGNNATYLTGGGTLATTNRQTLTLGGAGTGDISIISGSPVTGIGNNVTILAGGGDTGGNVTIKGGGGATQAGNVNIDSVATGSSGNVNLCTVSCAILNLGTAGGTAINIGTGASSGIITIGRTSSTDLVLNDANWNVTGAGAANFPSIGLVTPGSGAFTTLTSSGATTLGTGSSLTNTFGSGASSINTIGSITTPGALTLHGATTLDNTFTVSGSNLTSLGGNLTVTGTSWTATPTISGLITATSGITSNGTLAMGSNTLTSSGTIGTAATTTFTGAGATLTGLTLSSGAITLGGATGSGLCINGGATASWGSCGAGGGGTNYWDQVSGNGTSTGGYISPFNKTADLLLGSIATSSAKFGFLNVLTGTPTASISANSGGLATFLTGSGTLSTTLNSTLTLGGGATGNVIINPQAGALFGVGTTAPLASSDFRVSAGITGGIIATASVSGATSFAGLVVDNSGRGDIFTASSSGLTRFKITNNGTSVFQGDAITSIGNGASGNGSGAVTNAIGDEGSMVPNAGFEVKTVGAFADGWYAAASNSATITQDTTSPTKGTASVKIVLNSANTAIYSTCLPLSGAIGAYTLNYYAKAIAPVPVVRAYVDGYTSKANCQSDTSNLPTPPADVLVKTTSWVRYGTSTAAVGVTNTSTWGRVHFLIGCNASCASATVNIDGVRLTESTTGQGLDYAELYPGDPNNFSEPGDVVSVAKIDGKTVVIPASKYMDKSAIGVVSTNPGLVLDDGSVSDPKVAVALAGRIPTKVSTANGIIKVGDELTSSPIPGVAVKATKAGPTIGTAMEDYSESDPGKVGKIVMFVKNSYSNGVSSFVLDDTNTNSSSILTQLVAQAQNISSSSAIITTDKLIAGLEIITPKITADEIDVKRLKAGQIDGLEYITNRLDSLEGRIATIGATTSSSASAAISNESKLLLALENASSSATMPQNTTSLFSLNSDGLATVSGSLRVKNNGLFEGLLTVLDTITTNNFIANGLSTFFGDTIFKSKAEFAGPVTFSNDAGGQAVIKQGDTRVKVEFDTEFDQNPVINASVSFDQQKDGNGKVISTDALEQVYFAQGYSYVIVNKSTKGFTIVLNKKAKDDLNFTWTALRIKDAKTIQSRVVDQ